MGSDKQQGTPADARVAGAAAHWGFRFTANGTDYGDFTATLARITRWADWCREWGVTATHYEQLAAAADDAGHAATAAGAWKSVVEADDPLDCLTAAGELAVDDDLPCFRRLPEKLTVVFEKSAKRLDEEPWHFARMIRGTTAAGKLSFRRTSMHNFRTHCGV